MFGAILDHLAPFTQERGSLKCLLTSVSHKEFPLCHKDKNKNKEEKEKRNKTFCPDAEEMASS